MRRSRVLLVLAAIVILLILSAPLVLRAAGEFLISADAPSRADAIYVFAGDWNGLRVLKAAELVKQGYAPVALVGSPVALYGRQEADLAIDWAASHGNPREWFAPLYFTAHSTREEAQQLATELKRRNVHALIAVTSDFHTRRARRMLKAALGDGVRVTMVSAPDRYFRAGAWWQNREAQKTVFLEWTKTLTSAFGI